MCITCDFTWFWPTYQKNLIAEYEGEINMLVGMCNYFANITPLLHECDGRLEHKKSYIKKCQSKYKVLLYIKQTLHLFCVFCDWVWIQIGKIAIDEINNLT